MMYPKHIKTEAERLVYDLLKEMGQNPNREGLHQTPHRYVKFLTQFLHHEPYEFTTFENETDEMVIVKNIPFYSLCEHHLAPFFGTATIAYIPNERMVGLSKIPRCLDEYARGLQNQERIGTQVAERLMRELEPLGVAVLIEAEHLCVSMRGIEKHGVRTVTSKLLGVFRTDKEVRAEFLNLAK